MPSSSPAHSLANPVVQQQTSPKSYNSSSYIIKFPPASLEKGRVDFFCMPLDSAYIFSNSSLVHRTMSHQNSPVSWLAVPSSAFLASKGSAYVFCRYSNIEMRFFTAPWSMACSYCPVVTVCRGLVATCIDIMPDISEPDESFYALRACLFFSCMKRAKLNVPESRKRGAQSALWTNVDRRGILFTSDNREGKLACGLYFIAHVLKIPCSWQTLARILWSLCHTWVDMSSPSD